MTEKQKKQMRAYANKARKALKWVAVDDHGPVFAYTNKPELAEECGFWRGFGVKIGSNKKLACNWRETLTKIEEDA